MIKSGLDRSREAINELKEFHKLQMEAARQGIRLGDFIEKLIKYFKLDVLFGKEDCSDCKRTVEVLNSLRLNGWKIEWDKFKEL